jgi:hypothetical protein
MVPMIPVYIENRLKTHIYYIDNTRRFQVATRVGNICYFNILF